MKNDESNEILYARYTEKRNRKEFWLYRHVYAISIQVLVETPSKNKIKNAIYRKCVALRLVKRKKETQILYFIFIFYPCSIYFNLIIKHYIFVHSYTGFLFTCLSFFCSIVVAEMLLVIFFFLILGNAFIYKWNVGWYGSGRANKFLFYFFIYSI